MKMKSIEMNLCNRKKPVFYWDHSKIFDKYRENYQNNRFDSVCLFGVSKSDMIIPCQSSFTLIFPNRLLTETLAKLDTV